LPWGFTSIFILALQIPFALAPISGFSRATAGETEMQAHEFTAWFLSLVIWPLPVWANPQSTRSAFKVLICVNTDRFPRDADWALALKSAENLSSRMLASAAVALEWHPEEDAPCRKGDQARTVMLEFARGTPDAGHLDAFAYASPHYRIRVLLDSVLKWSTNKTQMPAVLAHVMTHEITHVLQGTGRHSETGVMKAHWDPQDFMRMAWKPLPFEPMDIVWIRRGLCSPASPSIPIVAQACTTALP
jgi:hypothetical protein